MCKAEERSYTRPIELSLQFYQAPVVRSYTHCRAVWSRCQIHGSQRPLVTHAPSCGGGRAFAQPTCPTCGRDAKLVTIETPTPKRGAKPTECNGACLNGKRHCSCRCGGRCHGAGVCQCNQAPQLALL